MALGGVATGAAGFFGVAAGAGAAGFFAGGAAGEAAGFFEGEAAAGVEGGDVFGATDPAEGPTDDCGGGVPGTLVALGTCAAGEEGGGPADGPDGVPRGGAGGVGIGDPGAGLVCGDGTGEAGGGDPPGFGIGAEPLKKLVSSEPCAEYSHAATATTAAAPSQSQPRPPRRPLSDG